MARDTENSLSNSIERALEPIWDKATARGLPDQVFMRIVLDAMIILKMRRVTGERVEALAAEQERAVA